MPSLTGALRCLREAPFSVPMVLPGLHSPPVMVKPSSHESGAPALWQCAAHRRPGVKLAAVRQVCSGEHVASAPCHALNRDMGAFVVAPCLQVVLRISHSSL